MPLLSHAVRRFLVERITHALPPTRLYKWKTYLYRWAGIEIAVDARVVSSASLLGTGRLTIGHDVFIGHQTLIIAAGSAITIADNVDIGPRVYVGNGSHKIDMRAAHSAGEGYSAPISIGRGVWIGAGSVILPGVTIGDKAIVGAGSVVASDIPPMVLAAGVPCRPIKQWNATTGEWNRV